MVSSFYRQLEKVGVSLGSINI